MNIDEAGGIVTVSGPKQNVLNAVHEVHTKLRKIMEERKSNEQARDLAKIVQWNYEEITETEYVLKPYGEMINFKIEMAFKNGKDSVQFNEPSGQCFEIDFRTLKEYPITDKEESLRVVRKNVFTSK